MIVSYSDIGRHVESQVFLQLFQNSNSFYDSWLVLIIMTSEDFDFFEVSLQGSQVKIISHLLFVGLLAIDRKREEVLATVLLVGDLNPAPIVEFGNMITGYNPFHAATSASQIYGNFSRKNIQLKHESSR